MELEKEKNELQNNNLSMGQNKNQYYQPMINSNINNNSKVIIHNKNNIIRDTNIMNNNIYGVNTIINKINEEKKNEENKNNMIQQN